jgi:dienelactone hydrolase
MIFSRDTQGSSCFPLSHACRPSVLPSPSVDATMRIEDGQRDSVFSVPTFIEEAAEMKRSFLVLLAVVISYQARLSGETQGGKDNVPSWPEVVQAPYEHFPTPAIGLKPLLVTADGLRITTKPAWQNQRQGLRSAWEKRLGRPPAKPAKLDAKIESQELERDHLRQLVTFGCEGDDRVRAYLLFPKDLQEGQKRPAVVVFHPTTKETLREPVGLGSRPEMALALQLVRRGYITLSPECFIMKGNGARQQAQELARRAPGWTGLGKMTFDASRCVDFLESLSQVDSSRIGCIGHSLGAKEVLYAMAFEPRYRAGVFNEGGIGLRMSNWTDPWYLGEGMKQFIPELENHQVMALIAPRAVLVMGGDSADGDASWAFVKEARSVYELLGARQRLGLYNHKAGHSFPPQARELAYRWLDHWLEVAPRP